MIRLRRSVMDLYSKAAELTAQRRPFAIATVVRVEGSSSARRGSKALIDAQGKIVMGWVGGGCAESAVRGEALRCIRSEKPELITLNMQDEVLGVGMPCGGMMDVYIEPVLPQPELVIAGHGRIAETLAALGRLMNFFVTVHDPQAARENFSAADRIINQDFGVTQIAFGPATYVVIATLHKNDHLWLQRALAGDAAYVALVASSHRARLVLDYLLAEGIPAEKVERVWAPAGLDLGAAAPEEIALSIISQIVAVRRGGATALKTIKDLTSAAPAAASSSTDKVIRQCDVSTEK
jgi:xanthine dehydrogenase accessory factor